MGYMNVKASISCIKQVQRDYKALEIENDLFFSLELMEKSVIFALNILTRYISKVFTV